MDLPVSGGVVAEVWKEVIMELPEDVQCDAAMVCVHSLVDLLEHGVPGIQLDILTHQPVS